MFTILKTNSANKDFLKLVELLDRDLKITDGEEHAFYDQFNQVDSINHVVVLYRDKEAISCGAIKEFAPGTMEIKRMFTKKGFRGKGLAGKVLEELESWAAELKSFHCILETGVRQPDAIALYRKCGYRLIPNYGQYENMENSLCFGKKIK